MIITGNFRRFQYFDFEINFLKNKFLKNLGTTFLLKILRSATQHFHTKLLCQRVTFYPRMKLVSERNHMVKCLLLFTRFSRDEIWSWDEISSRDEKEKERRLNTSCRDEILKWACFFKIFDVCIRFPKLTCLNFMKYEHDET